MSTANKDFNQSSLVIPLFIEKPREGSYFTVPFQMPANTEKLTLNYRYERFHEGNAAVSAGNYTGRKQVNIIDLGLIAPDGTQVGASGSDKSEFFVSEISATPGYKPHALVPGEWQILVGAYQVDAEGVNVTYELKFDAKQAGWLKGDLHAHTVASDGVQTVKELAERALRHGLDFLAITDHNQTISSDSLPKVDGVTLIPGLEWTHYKGHSNFLGCDQPYDGSFMANTPAEVQAHFESAHQRGATIVINHPFDEGCPFLFDLNTLPFDVLEVWNGPMRESNIKAVGLWHSLLAAGKKVAMCGGSDFHRDSLFLFPGGPTTHIFSMSKAPGDILAALRQGHAYVTFAPDGPTLEMQAGEAILGDTADWAQTKTLQLSLDGLLAGDVVRVATASATTPVLQAPANGRFELTYPVQAPGFARVEVLRAFLPGLPLLPALLSNPIYFKG
jgi:hypothetical protein